MELTEYRQITGGIGVALFVAGMAIWPAGVTAKPWNWALWTIGVAFAFLGIYVFVAATSANPRLRLPGKTAVFQRVKTRDRVQLLLAGMRLWGQWLSKPVNSTTEDLLSWCKDAIELLSKAYGPKHMALFTISNDEDDQTSWSRVIQTFDEFIVRSDHIPLQPQFVFDEERWGRYSTAPPGLKRPA